MLRPSRKVVVSGLAVILVLDVSSAFIHPFGAVKHQNSPRPLLSGSSITPEALRIITRSCQNCHSEKTEWPWYSYVAPTSWLLERDVSRARSRMNLSHWDEYPSQRRFVLLKEIPVMVGRRRMPPSRYLLMHPNAKLSDTEVKEITRWARAEGQRYAPRQTPTAGE